MSAASAGAVMHCWASDQLSPTDLERVICWLMPSSLLRSCHRYRWIRKLPGSREYTGAFTTATDQDVDAILTKILTYKLYQAPDFKKLKPDDQVDQHLYTEYRRALEQQEKTAKTKRGRSAKVSPIIAKRVSQVRPPCAMSVCLHNAPSTSASVPTITGLCRSGAVRCPGLTHDTSTAQSTVCS